MTRFFTTSRPELTVIKDNEKAFNLYRKMGFVLEGEKVHSLIINGKPVNEYIYIRCRKRQYPGGSDVGHFGSVLKGFLAVEVFREPVQTD
ncbi:hypothetical protein Cdeb_01403 [Caldibacillus debilis GB1]|uniref:Acetyltransferase n=1 Tax=Caldibacillus debilis GB1 TaxID=1339248 RepID=A0A420VCV1_9BACI|nr:hypothetical protein Cdeb_01403 [Caldibacillus debilis GB1]